MRESTFVAWMVAVFLLGFILGIGFASLPNPAGTTWMGQEPETLFELEDGVIHAKYPMRIERSISTDNVWTTNMSAEEYRDGAGLHPILYFDSDGDLVLSSGCSLGTMEENDEAGDIDLGTLDHVRKQCAKEY